jgi:hypothetical protein
MWLYVPCYLPYKKHNINIHAPGGIFFSPCPVFSFDPFYTFKSFCPSCSILLSLYNTTQTSMPPAGLFFFTCPGFFPFYPFLYCLNPFSSFMSLYVPCYCPYTTNTTQTSMSQVGFEPTIPVSKRPKTHALDRTATGISDSNPRS